MNKTGLFYMCAAWFMAGLILGYFTASHGVVKVKTDMAIERMVK